MPADVVNLPIILLASLVAAASPGPATLSIAGTSMASGRTAGLVLALGITTGSLIWSVSAALGLGALMQANAWVLEGVRYAGAGYLLFLAWKSARSALRAGSGAPRDFGGTSLRRVYAKGLALHLTNPKAVLFFGSLYAIGIPPGASPAALATVIVAIGVQSMLIFHGYAFLFSNGAMTRGYMRMRRWFDGAFALGFGAAGLRILTARLQ